MEKKIVFTWMDGAKYFIKLLITIAILTLCFRLIDWQSFSQALVSVDPVYYFFAICVTTIASIIMPALVTWTAQRTGRLSFSLMDLILINFSVRLYTILLPRAIATGMRWIKYRKDSSGRDALVIIVFEKVAQMTIMMTFASVFLFFELKNLHLKQGGIYLFYLTLLLNLICLLGFVVFFYKPLASWLQIFFHKLDFMIPVFIKRRIDSFWESVSAFQKLNYNDITACLVYSGISYVLFIVAPYIIVQSMDINISIYALAWMRGIIMLLTLMPVTVAGLGVREISFIAFLELYGIPRSTAFAFSLLLFFQHIFIASVGLINEMWIFFLKQSVAARKNI